MNNNSLYRASGNVKDINRTHVSDIYQQALTDMQSDGDAFVTPNFRNARTMTLQDRQMIGVMYSISAGINGELFPIYIGRNTIGSDLSCDICLRETSISSLHGILLAREQVDDSGEKYINATLADDNSMYGTCVNDERIGFEKVSLKDGDIITIGMNYIFIISLFNAIGKLTVSRDIQFIQEDASTEDYSDIVSNNEKILPKPIPVLAETHLQDKDSFSTKKDIPITTSESEFYKPTKEKNIDHFNSKTLIL